ncbi:MAG TPA: aspartate aminotransferase family protein [Pirellulales bacterium]|nr:aspartate aminotransferase family protein [Pirellulales bacterium]
MLRKTDPLESDRAFLIHSLHSALEHEAPHLWTQGRGAVLVDADGREYLDALAGLWNVNVGHGREEIAQAAAEQMRTLAFATTYAGSTNRPAIALAQRLAEISYPTIRRFFFTSGGAEANESAFKTARWYWKIAGRPAKQKIIALERGYHGTTLAAMSATGIDAYRQMCGPPAPGFLHIESPYPYRFAWQPRSALDRRTPGIAAADLLAEAIEREGADTVAAFVAEPVQGAGGTIVPPADYWPRIREICRRHEVLLIADEVITGFGRTGDWFGLARWGVEPDLLTFAKGVTSGYFPLGGMGVSDAIAAAIQSAEGDNRWMHAFTASAHPVGCAVALANLDIIEREGLVERARELGARLLSGLKTLEVLPQVGEVRGLGLMAGVELVADRETKTPYPAEFKAGQRVHAETQKRGMFTRLRGDIYNLAPPFVTTSGQIDRMVEILGESIAAALG